MGFKSWCILFKNFKIILDYDRLIKATSDGLGLKGQQNGIMDLQKIGFMGNCSSSKKKGNGKVFEWF